jgi:glycosyltransferase involved in cell wall biosynthesis
MKTSLPAILLPALDEARCIGAVLAAIPKRLAPGVLVVDGGSTDGTPDVVRSLGFPVMRQEGRGLGRAVATGLENTHSDIVVVLDADGSHDPGDIPRLLSKLEEGFDLVVASRYSEGPADAGMLSLRRRSTSRDDTPVRAFGNRIFTSLCRSLHGVPIHDVLNGFKAFRRSILGVVSLDRSDQDHDVELVIQAARAGLRLSEVPIVEHRRIAGRSKVRALYHGALILGVIVRQCFRADGSIRSDARDRRALGSREARGRP